MKIPSFVKLPSNKSFDFPTRFYDADKERIENRKKELEAEMNLEAEGSEEEIRRRRENLKSRIDFSQYRRDRDDKSSSLILVAVGAVLLISFYVAFSFWLQ